MEYKGDILKLAIANMHANLLFYETIHSISDKTGLRQETIKKVLEGKGNAASLGILIDYYAANHTADFMLAMHEARVMAKNLMRDKPNIGI